MRRASKIVAVVALAVLALAAVGFSLRTRDTSGDGGMTLYGNVDIRDVSLAFRVTGRLSQLAFDEGDSVHAGDVVGRLDAEPFEREMREAQASVASLKARLALLRAGYRKGETGQAAALVAERKSTVANSQRLLSRQAQLTGTGASSQRLYDDALAARDEAAARLRSAEESLHLFETGYRPEEIAEAAANLARAEATLAQAQLKIDDTVLHAPTDGVILTRAAEPGTILQSGTTVFTLALLHPVWVRAYVAEASLGRVPSGTTVLVHTDSRPGKSYAGRVGFVSPTAEFTPKSVETQELRTDLVYRLRIVVEDADAALRQGMPVTVTVHGAGQAS